jgi:CRP/FNR family transcriptional regulator
MSSDIESLLRRCELFASAAGQSLQRLAGTAQPASFASGQQVLQQNEPCPGLYIVETGFVREFKKRADDKQHTLQLVGPAGALGTMAAIGDFLSPASAEAVAETQAYLFSGPSFRAALSHDHELCRAVLSGVTIQSRHLVNLIEDVVLRDAVGRLAHYLLELPAGPDGVSQLPTLKRYVASHLNITCETFSRTMRRLVQSGMISQPSLEEVRILDRDRLMLLAAGNCRERVAETK